MMGPPKVEKGLFITTAKFSQGAMDFAKAQHIILVDGEKLTELMIEYNLGVSAQKHIKSSGSTAIIFRMTRSDLHSARSKTSCFCKTPLAIHQML